MNELKNKKIIFITSKFFNYYKLIKKEMENKGAIVHFFDERNNPNVIDKILMRKANFLLSNKINNYYRKIAFEEKNFNPDYIFFISPEAITKTSLIYLKNNFPKSKFILYMWDSVKNKGIRNLLEYFDHKLSFDPNDCKKYNMKFRPLFFLNEFKKKEFSTTQKYKYDLAFIGTVHSDRAKILLELKDFCDKNNLSYYFYLYVPDYVLLLLRKFFSKSLRNWNNKYIHTKPLSIKKIKNIYSYSKSVVDINHPHQTGLTMRTIEMLGMHKKLITTNSNIKYYDFFRPTNQIIIDRNNIKLSKDQFLYSYEEYSNIDYNKYTLDSWIKDIFQ